MADMKKTSENLPGAGENSKPKYRRVKEKRTIWADEPIEVEESRWQKHVKNFLTDQEEWIDGASFIEVDGVLFGEARFEEILNEQEKDLLTEEEAIEIVREYIEKHNVREKEEKARKAAEAIFQDDELEEGYEQACENAGIPKFLR